MILVGDVGGTKCILALYERINDGWHCRKKELYASAQYSQFSELLTAFLSDIQTAVTAACIGVAGPIIKGDCITTNLPWALKRDEISSVTNTAIVWLLNDLEASAWGVSGLPDTELIELNPNSIPTDSGNQAVVAAGTGLGEALMIWNGSNHQIIATEGGHADFAPGDQQQIGLLSYLMQQYGDHVSYERVLSGKGLVNIYDYLTSIDYAPKQPGIEQRMQLEDPAAVIGTTGVEGHDVQCREALNIFCRIYGAETGNLALKCLPHAGIYLTGGIAGKILPVLNNGEFIKGYLNKGRSKTVIENISIKVCINHDVALLGALRHLETKVKTL